MWVVVKSCDYESAEAVSPCEDTPMTTNPNEIEDIERRITQHVMLYDTPRQNDPRRRFTQAQLETAIRLAAASARGVADGKFKIGDRVQKIKGSSWRGRIVGTYSTSLTPEGYAVESDTETGSVQIYPAKALSAAPSSPAVTPEEEAKAFRDKQQPTHWNYYPHPLLKEEES